MLRGSPSVSRLGSAVASCALIVSLAQTLCLTDAQKPHLALATGAVFIIATTLAVLLAPRTGSLADRSRSGHHPRRGLRDELRHAAARGEPDLSTGMVQTVRTFSGLVGPTLATLLIGLPTLLSRQGGWPASLHDGVPFAPLVDGVGFLLAAAVLARLHIPSPPPAEDHGGATANMKADTRLGWTYLRRRPPLLHLLSCVAAINLAIAAVPSDRVLRDRHADLMPEGDDLKYALLHAPVWTPGQVLDAYRTVPLAAMRRYSPDPLNTAGSIITGRRYDAPQDLPGVHELLYLAENLAVAHAEAQAITTVRISAGVLVQPSRLDITVKLRLGAVLGLLDPAVVAQLRLTDEDLFQDWFLLNLDGELARTQVLARAVLDSARYDALRYPGGRNYAVFPDRVAPQDRAVHDPEDELAVFRRP